MKNYFLLLLIGITLFNCSNDDENTSTDNQLIGKWNWIESHGGFDDRTETPNSTGNTIRLEVSNSVVKKFVNGILDSELNYSIELGASTIIEGEYQMLVYENEFHQSIILTGNQLVLIDECNDCFQSTYEKE